MVGVLVAGAVLPASHSEFTAATANQGSSFEATALGAPASLAADSDCTGGASAMPTFVAAGAAAEGLSSDFPPDLVLTRPAAQVGDLLVVTFVGGTSVIPPAEVGTTTSYPFTVAVQHASATETTLAIDVRYRWIVSGEPTTYGFALENGRTAGQLRLYRNVNTATPFGAASGWISPGTGTFATAPSVTTTSPNNLVLAVQGVRSLKDDPAFTNPTGTALTDITQMVNPSPANNSVSGRVGHIAMASAGATGNSTIAHVSKFLRLAIQVPILPASGGQVTLTWSTAAVQAEADGYELSRINGGVTEETFTISGSSTATYDDTTAGNGTFTYSLRAKLQQWRSAATTTNVTRSC